MLEGMLQAGNQAMNQASAPVQPGDEQAQFAAPQQEAVPQGEAPTPSVDFDVEKNPQDMQFMTDAMMYVPMLKGMDSEQRKEKWPTIVQQLSEVSPKAAAMFDPTLPPADADLNAIMSRMKPKEDPMLLADGTPTRGEYLEDQVKRQVAGQNPISPGDYVKQRGAEEEEKNRIESLKKQEQAQNDTKNMSQEEFIFHAAMMAGKGSQYMTASLKDVMKDPRYTDVPSGYRWKDPNNKDAGYEAVPGGPDDGGRKPPKELNPGVNPGQAAMIKTADSLLPLIQSLAFNEDGGLNTSNLKAAWSGLPDKLTGTQGSQYSQAVNTSIEAALRAMTGAAAPDSEVKKYTNMYTCKPWDTELVCAQKYVGLKSFIKNYQDYALPDQKGVNTPKAEADNANLQVKMLMYRDKWMKKQMEAYPDANPEDLNKLYVKKMLQDPNFVTQINKE